MRVDDLIGKPYQKGGRGPEAYDCAGLVVEVMRRRGIHFEIPSTPDAERDQHTAMRQILSAQWVGIEKPFPGCLVFFKPAHVGVMLSPRVFIHTREGVGQACIERLEGPMWPQCLDGFYEYGGPRP